MADISEILISLKFLFLKDCSINFEPPDIALCSSCHVYTISGGAWIISILFILNRFTWGLSWII